jgi:hypothetical protein
MAISTELASVDTYGLRSMWTARSSMLKSAWSGFKPPTTAEYS